VIAYDSKTGEVTDVMNAALVNIPCLDLNAVAQERMAQLNANFPHQPELSTMNEVLKALLTALGLPVSDATTTEQATAAVAALKANAAKADELTTQVAALKASTTPDPTKWVALDKFNELNTEVARLSASNVDREVNELLASAVAQGKCPPVVEGVWREVGKKDIAQLKALIANTPATQALAGLSQTAGRQLEKRDPNAAATAEELAMCKNMGLTLEQFRSGAVAAA
jgi:phage I-like protein